MYLNLVSKSFIWQHGLAHTLLLVFGGGLVWWWCTLEVESLDNVLLSTSGLDLPRLRKSTGVIGISILLDVDSILRRFLLKVNVFCDS